MATPRPVGSWPFYQVSSPRPSPHDRTITPMSDKGTSSTAGMLSLIDPSLNPNVFQRFVSVRAPHRVAHKQTLENINFPNIYK